MMKALVLVSLLTLFACSRAQWQEDLGGGHLAQDRVQPKPETSPPSAPAPGPDESPRPEPTPAHRPPQAFDDCKSQTLSVEINTAKTQDNLRDFWTTSARYSQIKVTPAAKTKTRTTLYLNASDSSKHACKDQSCAEVAGWSQIQNDILDLNGIALQCLGQRAPRKVATTFSTDN